jgi:hypothetical protein
VKDFLHGGKGTGSGRAREQEAQRGVEAVETLEEEFSLAELEEFLACDALGVVADPEFKERLRRTLWEMLQRTRTGDAGS